LLVDAGRTLITHIEGKKKAEPRLATLLLVSQPALRELPEEWPTPVVSISVPAIVSRELTVALLISAQESFPIHLFVSISAAVTPVVAVLAVIAVPIPIEM